MHPQVLQLAMQQLAKGRKKQGSDFVEVQDLLRQLGQDAPAAAGQFERLLRETYYEPGVAKTKKKRRKRD